MKKITKKEFEKKLIDSFLFCSVTIEQLEQRKCKTLVDKIRFVQNYLEQKSITELKKGYFYKIKEIEKSTSKDWVFLTYENKKSCRAKAGKTYIVNLMDYDLLIQIDENFLTANVRYNLE